VLSNQHPRLEPSGLVMLNSWFWRTRSVWPHYNWISPSYFK